jgi:hypothetical protein
MDRRSNTVEALIREGFSLLLELRRHNDAQRLIPLANAFLGTLLQQADSDAPPLVVSVKAVPIRRR